MVLYNITISVDGLILDKWMEWMKNEHIPEIMSTGHFKENRMFRLLNEESNGVTYACQYFAKNVEDVLEFQEKHASQLQNKMQLKFGNSTVDFRTMLQEEK